MALVAAWAFDAGTGTTAVDATGNGHAATVSGWTTGHTSYGAVGDSSHSAFHYSGTLVSSPTAWTFMGWVKPTTNDGGDTLLFVSNDESASSWWVEVDWSDSTHLQLETAWGVTPASVTTSVGAWVHVAVSWSASANLVTLYLNGVSVATKTSSGTLTPGQFEGGGWAYFGNVNTGIVDDARFDNTALSPTDITTYMNTPVGGGSNSYAASGAVSSTSSVAGAVTARLKASGAVVATSASVGAVTSRLPSTGAVSSGSTVAGAIASRMPVSGIVTSTTTVIGSLSPPGLSGAVASTSTVAGSVTSGLIASGSVASTSAVAGMMQPEGGLSGTVASISTVTGSVTARYKAAGAVATVSTVTGSMDSPGGLSGTVATASTVAGAVTARYSIAGMVLGMSTVTGTITSSADQTRDITITISTAPQRLSIQGVERWSVQPTPYRWEIS